MNNGCANGGLGLSEVLDDLQDTIRPLVSAVHTLM
jgi:hypothetical protein